MANFKIYLLRQFCSNQVEFFYNTQETQTQKMMDQNFEIVWFLEFLKFSKRRRTVPLWLIWTIMVAAKLDHSRVLVTKFHQNRSTLKGRSAGQRPTDRHTDRQTRLKIRALQVCSRAKNGAKVVKLMRSHKHRAEWLLMMSSPAEHQALLMWCGNTATSAVFSYHVKSVCSSVVQACVILLIISW